MKLFIMGTEIDTMKIEQLKESNYHDLKIRTRHVLILKSLKKCIFQDLMKTSTELIPKDESTQELIELRLPDELLKHLREVTP